MNSFAELFLERANRILAFTKIGQIALEGLSQISKDKDSAFLPLFQFMADRIPDQHQNHKEILMPEYKVVGFLDGMSLIAIISEVEAYFYDIVVAVLLKHPDKIAKSTFDLKTLLELASIQEAVQFSAEKFAGDMLFKKPNEYKKDLISVLSINEDVLKITWPIFIEAKARRDIGVHNGWIVNDIYRAKVREVSLPAPTETALTVDSRYLEMVRQNCVELMGELAKHCKLKFQ